MQHENPITTVCRTSQHFLNNDILDPASLPLGSYFPATRSQLVLPLRVSQKVLGALEILSDQPQTFSDEDVLLLRSLADQVTIAIRNATLYEAERSRRHLAETFQRIGRAISGNRTR
jgi:GAF domain-containing protein